MKFKIYILFFLFFGYLILYITKPITIHRFIVSLEDFKYTVRSLLNKVPTPNDSVVVVEIDEKSINYFGRWPWDRKITAKLIGKLNQANLVGLDIVFSEKSNPESDKILVETIEKNNNVITGFFFRTKATQTPNDLVIDYLENCSITRYKLLSIKIGLKEFPFVEANLPEILSASLSCAFFNIEPDVDGLYRHYPVAYLFEGMIFPSLAIQMYRFYKNQDVYLEIDKSGIKKATIGDIKIKGNYILINYYNEFNTISAYDVIKGNVDEEFFKGKLVLIGATEMGIFDVRPTPVDPMLPGVYLHFNTLSNLLNKELLQYSHIYNILLTFSSLSLLFITSLLRRLKIRFLLYAVFISTPFIVSSYLFIYKYLWLDAIYPFLFSFLYVLILEIYNYFVVEEKSRQIKNAFSKYVSPEVVEQISKNPESLELGGTEKEISILFTDIKDFTNITEKLKPQEVAKLLNIYLEYMSKIVLQNKGLLDKYIGDAIMAIFNAPIDIPEHQYKACLSATMMIQNLENVNNQLEKLNLPPISMGIGIHTGKAIVGNLGSSFRFEYTAVGDTVNLASRLESLTRYYNVYIIVSQDIYDIVKDKLNFRKLDKVKVKGKDESIVIYELLIEYDKNLVLNYEKALNLYLSRNFETALIIFEELWEKYKDTPSYIFIGRCKEFIKNPPKKNWDGSYEFKSK